MVNRCHLPTTTPHLGEIHLVKHARADICHDVCEARPAKLGLYELEHPRSHEEEVQVRWRNKIGKDDQASPKRSADQHPAATL